ncbi:MAG: prepilin-type N-terminal cleavage/methylation domain-containing protein [Lachnospiraceae bacterium]|nr:prepilin-type N-terminal cleavage/methylation domain-containing protein [Lachnospiraceae bacterium]
MRKANKDNRGVTLIELLMVVAIIGVLIGIMAAGFNLGRSKVGSATNLIDTSLSQARSFTMTRSVNYDFKLYVDNGYYMVQVGGMDAEKAMEAKIPIYYKTYSAGHESGWTQVTGGGITIQFSESSGAMKKLPGTGSVETYYSKLCIGNPNGSYKTITLIFETGKHFVGET